MNTLALRDRPSPTRRQWLGGAVLALAGGAGWWAWRGAPARPVAAPPVEVCRVAPLWSWEASSGVPLHAPRPVPAEARCPVCGMHPARHPTWAAQAVFDDGATHFLDSPVELCLYLREVPRHASGRLASQLRALYVTDTVAGAGHWLDARTAWYVLGSRVAGPMRNGNLPAFADRDAAEAFTRAQGGRVLAWGALDGPWLDRLDTRHVHSG